MAKICTFRARWLKLRSVNRLVRCAVEAAFICVSGFAVSAFKHLHAHFGASNLVSWGFWFERQA
jgi:hypothetical protein